jgi:hypothetical protein
MKSPKRKSHSRNSSSSGRAAGLKMTKDILALGNQIVSEFGLKRDDDTLGQWMAHNLAEMLTAVKTAKGSQRAVLEADCRGMILKFWKHRAYFPGRHRPFANFDAVFRALESLDPTKKVGRYFDFDFTQETEKRSPTQGIKDWLGTARALDQGARTLITFCVREAAMAAGKKDKQWLKAARVLQDESDLDLKFIIKIVGGLGPAKPEQIDPKAAQRQGLEALKENLRAMIDVAVPFINALDKEIKLLPRARKR